MSVDAQAVQTVTNQVWRSLLGADGSLTVVEPGAADDSLVTGCVTVSGGWDGAVAVGCSSSLARQLTGAMFQVEPDVVSTDELADAIGELANMIGGNIKGLMPGPSKLSLPAVTIRESGLVLPGCKLLVNQSFEWGGERMRVQVLQRAATTTESREHPE
ncbi:MAG: chemotaxis protein CheX [Myxococcales bacterium]|nr:chemotaxis protein CheX [Myxococcales bacterium]